jgi:hypothetical protein
MRLTPRKEEIKEVVATLESDQFDSADAMAKALIKQVADILWMRDWYVLGTKFSEDSTFWLPYGPFASESEAESVFKKYGAGGKYARTVKIYSPGRLVAYTTGKQGWPGYCAGCGCDPSWHLQDGSSRGKCVQCPDCSKFKK